MALDDRIMDQAAAWAARTGDPSFEDWEGFTAWLEGSPDHARAYDLVMTSAGDAARLLADEPRADAAPVEALLAANDDFPALRSSRRWAIGSMAAALVAVLAFATLHTRAGTYTIETAAGETQVIALDNGSQITLGGGSTVTLDRDDPRFARLEKGQALFSIRHDADNPFRVDAGEDKLVDIGTVFDVRFDGLMTTVAVSEGAVSFNPARENLRIDPGKFVSSNEGSRAYELGDIPGSEVGAWSTGRLSFQQATLGAVADDLTRATGEKFSASAGAAKRRVSGSLLVDPVKADPGSVGPLLGVRVSKAGGGWMLEAR